MVKSMTGYGRARETRNKRDITVEVRSVNNRYLDCTVKLPRAYVFAEDAIKGRVQKAVSRGKVDVFVTIDSSAADVSVVKVNEPLARSYYEALLQLKETFGLSGEVTPVELSRCPDVLSVTKAEEDLEMLAEDICQVTDAALAAYNRMRSVEGVKLAEDIAGRADTIERTVARVEEQSPQTVSAYRERLESKMREVLASTTIDEARILTETAIFADKIAVDEETVRLRSHIAQLRQMLESGSPVGRKADFLIQEFNREANTIGSKCQNADIAKVVVDLKEFGIVQRALLGIRFAIVDQDFIDREGKELGITELGGAYVAGVVEGGSASEAGIRKGDVILDIDGVKINDNATLSEQIGRRRPNDKVKLSVKRDGAVKQFEVTLRNKAGKTELMTKEDVDVVEVLGGKFADAGTKLCRELDIRGGVQVVGIKADGILARARVKQGFVITHINDRPVYSVADMQRMDEKVRSIDGIYPNGRAASYTLVE